MGTGLRWDSICPRVEEDALNGWGLRAVLHRGRSQWGLLAVVAAVSLLACTMTSGLALTYRATRDFGLAHTLATLDRKDTSVVAILDQGGGQPLAPAIQAVTGALAEALPLPVISRTEATTSEWANPVPPLGATAWMYFAHYDGVADHVRLVSGHLPRPDEKVGAGRVAVAIPRTLAEWASLRVGSRVPTVEAQGSAKAEAVVVGIYDVTELQRKDAFWAADTFSGATFDPNFSPPGSFGMFSVLGYGPLLTAREGFTDGPLHPARTVLTSVPDLSGVTPETLPQVQGLVAGLDTAAPRLVADSFVQHALVYSQLGYALDLANRALVVTTAGLLITGILLIVLAVAALLLATRLLAERRSTEQTLMRARGASGWQLARLAALEAGLLALLTAVASPLLALPLYRAVASSALFSEAGLDRDPGLPPAVWVVSVGTAVALVTVLLTPLLRRAGTFVEQEQAAARQDRRSLIQRSGLDVGLLLLAALGYWQLLRYSSPLAESADGPSVDPLLVAGPGLVLLAGGLLSVRAIPVLARRLERLAARGPAVVWPLASWEVGRRARRSVGAVLLLSLTVAAGTFSLAYLDTWRTSQVDQADARVGTDAVVDLTLSTDPAVQLTRLREAARKAGVTLQRVMPVLSREAGLSVANDSEVYGAGTNVSYGVAVQMLGVDATTMASMVRGRVGDPHGELKDLFTGLASTPTPAAAGMPLPPGTRVLGVDATLKGRSLPAALIAEVTFVVDAPDGVRRQVPMGEVELGGRQHLEVTLPDQVVATDPARPGAVARLDAIQVTWRYAGPMNYQDGAPEGTLTLSHVTGGTAGAPQLMPLSALHDLGLTADGVSVPSQELGKVPVRPGSSQTEDALIIGAVLVPDGSRSVDSPEMTTTVVAWPQQAPVNAFVTPGAIARFGISVGDEVALVIDGTAVPVIIAGTTSLVPGTDGHHEALVLDADALSRRMAEYGQEAPTMNRWWVRVSDADVPALTAAVKTLSGTTTSAWEQARRAHRASLAVGLQTAQWLVVLAAAVLAGIGFALNTAVAIRLRRIEFAQMLAIGVRRRDLERVVAAETALLWSVGVVCGVVVGVLLTRTLPPLVEMSAQGGMPVPPVRVHVPLPQLGLLIVSVAALLTLVVAGVTRTLRGSVLGSVLRLGDER